MNQKKVISNTQLVVEETENLWYVWKNLLSIFVDEIHKMRLLKDSFTTEWEKFLYTFLNFGTNSQGEFFGSLVAPTLK
jgi:hypothetical protein